VEGKGEEGGK